MRRSFILHLDSLVILDEMTNEQAGQFIKAIHYYRKEGRLPELDFAMKMAITPFINQFTRDDKKYDNIAERNKINGSKGGRPKIKNSPKNPMGYLETQTNQNKPRKADNDSDSDNDNGNKKDSNTSITSNIDNNIITSTSEAEDLKNLNQNEVNEVENEEYIDCENLVKEIGGVHVLDLLSENGKKKVQAYCPKWDIMKLACAFAKNIREEKISFPRNVNYAFPAWCLKYTKGVTPK